MKGQLSGQLSILDWMPTADPEYKEDKETRFKSLVPYIITHNGTGFCRGKCRVYQALVDGCLNAKFLKEEYGIGGQSYHIEDFNHCWIDYSAACYKVVWEDREFGKEVVVKTSWTDVAKYYQDAFIDGTFLKEVLDYKEYTSWLNDEQQQRMQQAMYSRCK